MHPCTLNYQNMLHYPTLPQYSVTCSFLDCRTWLDMWEFVYSDIRHGKEKLVPSGAHVKTWDLLVCRCCSTDTNMKYLTRDCFSMILSVSEFKLKSAKSGHASVLITSLHTTVMQCLILSTVNILWSASWWYHVMSDSEN